MVANNNTQAEILELLNRSETPLTSKIIAFQLKKTNDNIRKLLSNMANEGKILRLEYGMYDSLSKSVNISPESVNEQKLIKDAKNEYNRKWSAENREKRRIIQNRYWLKKAKKNQL